MVGQQAGTQMARARALSVLRVRGAALAVALLPAAAAVILFVGDGTGHFGAGWDTARWALSALALLSLGVAGVIAAVVARAEPAVTPTVPVAERSAPDLYNLVRELADRLDVPPPSAIALTPDCDSWLEERAGSGAFSGERRQSGEGGRGPRSSSPTGGVKEIPVASRGPVLVIGSPFLWWMRVAELRALLAPVVAGTGPSSHPDIAAARRFVLGLDAAVAITSRPPLVRYSVGWICRLLLRTSAAHAAEMERGVAAAASARASTVDYGVRAVAQEQVGLAYAGWDRLLTRVALPAWRVGRWPAGLNAGVVAALTELSHRDRLAEGFTSRLGERPACDLLEEPGSVDESVSLLAARTFLGEPSGGWSPVGWSGYPEEVVDRIWRTEAERLFTALGTMEPAPEGTGGTLNHVIAKLATPGGGPPGGGPPGQTLPHRSGSTGRSGSDSDSDSDSGSDSGSGSGSGSGSDSADAETSAHAGTSGSIGTDGPAPGPAAPEHADSSPAADAEPADAEPADAESADDESTGASPTAATGRAVAPGRADPGHSGSESAGSGDLPAPGSAGAVDGPVGGSPGSGGGAVSGPRRESATGAAGEAGGPEAGLSGGGPGAPFSPESALGPAEPGGERGPAGAAGGEEGPDGAEETGTVEGEALAARISAAVAREEAERGGGGQSVPGVNAGETVWIPGGSAQAMGLPLQPRRTGKELLVEHVMAAVCCAAADTGEAAPGLDWLDGPVLLVDGIRACELSRPVSGLVEYGDAGPLREWLTAVGVRADKPVRLL